MAKDLRKEIVKALTGRRCKCGGNKFYVIQYGKNKEYFCEKCGREDYEKIINI